MFRYIANRLLIAVPTIIGLSMLVFLLIHLLPGNAADVMLAEQGVTGEQLKELEHKLGLDQPVYVQYWRFAKGAVHGDLGRSLFSNQPVTTQIMKQLPATLKLTLSAIVVTVVLGLPLGVIAAIKRGTWIDTGAMLFSLVGATMPSFWSGLLLIYLFSLKLHWFPAAGTAGWKSLVMPSLTLGLYSTAVVARLTRTSLLETLSHDYIATARSKGLSERTTIIRHALRNSLLPVVTVMGLQVGYLLGGAVITESVFARQGVGQLAVGAIQQRDGPLVVGIVLFVAVIFVMANLIVDILYGVLDPRIRYE